MAGRVSSNGHAGNASQDGPGGGSPVGKRTVNNNPRPANPYFGASSPFAVKRALADSAINRRGIVNTPRPAKSYGLVPVKGIPAAAKQSDPRKSGIA
eukprot:3937582-Alexandrium_andersonii.AAC.1